MAAPAREDVAMRFVIQALVAMALVAGFGPGPAWSAKDDGNRNLRFVRIHRNKRCMIFHGASPMHEARHRPALCDPRLLHAVRRANSVSGNGHGV